MWNDLTMSERAGVIKMAVKAGLRDMKSIRDFYDNSLKYADGGSKPGMTGMMKSKLAIASLLFLLCLIVLITSSSISKALLSPSTIKKRLLSNLGRKPFVFA